MGVFVSPDIYVADVQAPVVHRRSRALGRSDSSMETLYLLASVLAGPPPVDEFYRHQPAQVQPRVRRRQPDYFAHPVYPEIEDVDKMLAWSSFPHAFPRRGGPRAENASATDFQIGYLLPDTFAFDVVAEPCLRQDRPPRDYMSNVAQEWDTAPYKLAWAGSFDVAHRRRNSPWTGVDTAEPGQWITAVFCEWPGPRRRDWVQTIQIGYRDNIDRFEGQIAAECEFGVWPAPTWRHRIVQSDLLAETLPIGELAKFVFSGPADVLPRRYPQVEEPGQIYFEYWMPHMPQPVADLPVPRVRRVQGEPAVGPLEPSIGGAFEVSWALHPDVLPRRRNPHEQGTRMELVPPHAVAVIIPPPFHVVAGEIFCAGAVIGEVGKD